MKCFVPCSKGLEYLLVDELLALGAEHASAAVAGVNVECEARLVYAVAMQSRLASRALWPLAEFACADSDALYAAAAAIDWREHLRADASLWVDANVSGPAITHARYAAQRVKDAIVDCLRDADGVRPNVDGENPDLLLNLSVRKGRAVLAVDLGGGSLHRRGWRQAQGEAPLKENLAAAMLLRGGWPALVAQGAGLLDPMCGSGTLVIEAAAMAYAIAPGLQRYGERAPTRWLGFDAGLWDELRAQARAAASAAAERPLPKLLGGDSDPLAIRAAKANAKRAGLADRVEFVCRDFAATPTLPAERGLVVCNPPYDARLAAEPALYRQLGDTLRRVAPGWRAALLCGDRELAHATGLRARKPYTLFNGPLECSLIVCDPIGEGEAPHERKPLSSGATMVANRLRKNLRHLRAWSAREQVSCFRVYDADLPEYAAAIDLYREDGGAQRLFAHVQEYAPPASIPEADARRRFSELLRAVGEVFELPRERIAVKTRARGKGGSKYGRQDARDEWLCVREGAVRLWVNLFDWLDTGLFLDHRSLRLRLAAEAAGKRFLNLFAYTGAASVHAAVGGALGTMSVDLSATWLRCAERNLRENGCAGSVHRLLQGDVMAWLGACRDTFDLIFCDPPTFSNSARAEDFDVQRAHVELLRLCMARLAPGGVLYFSNNFRRFRLDGEALAAFAEVEDISAETIPPDFARNPHIHRCWRLRPRG